MSKVLQIDCSHWIASTYTFHPESLRILAIFADLAAYEEEVHGLAQAQVLDRKVE